jgi:hypothetical protein
MKTNLPAGRFVLSISILLTSMILTMGNSFAEGIPFEVLQKQVDALRLEVDGLRSQIESLGITIDNSGTMTLAPTGDVIVRPGGRFLVNTDTTMTGNSRVEGQSEIKQQLSVLGDTFVMGNSVLGDTLVMGSAEMARDLKINGRLSLMPTQAKIDEYYILQAVDPEATLASTVNIIYVPNAQVNPDRLLEFIPAPEGVEYGTMMTLTYSPLGVGGEINYYAPPIRVVNCRRAGGCSPETKNIVLKSWRSENYEMDPGSTLTLVNSYQNIWYEISRSSAQSEVFHVQTPQKDLYPGQFFSASVNCVSAPDGKEQAIFLAANINVSSNSEVEILQEGTQLAYGPLGSTYEVYWVNVKNNSSGLVPFRVRARCLLP